MSQYIVWHVNDELCNIATCFKLNKLSLIVKKTNYILFRGGHKSIKNSGLCIKIDDVNVERVDQTKFLGVIINERLNWNDHIIAVCSKVSKNTGILYRTRKNFNVSTLMLLCQTLIQPYFEYCNVLWCIDDSQYLKKLFAKQKNAVRTITFGKWNSHTAPIFAKFKILNIYSIY